MLGSAQQVVLNEVYTSPGSNNHEFLELFNSSFKTINSNGYTVVTYYKNSTTDEGVYVLDLPTGVIQPGGFYVAGAASTISYQSGTYTANCNWNALGVDDNSVTNTTGGYLKKFKKNGTGYQDVSADLSGGLNDFFMNTGIQPNYCVFVYANGVLVNTFFGKANSVTIPVEIRNLPDITISVVGGAISSFNLSFSSSAIIDNKGEFVIPNDGSDNGYVRLRDGQCGTWEKASAQKNHTPGQSNGSTGLTGSLVANTTLVNDQANNRLVIGYRVTSGTASAFPYTVQVVEDFSVSTASDLANTPNKDERYLTNSILDEGDKEEYVDPTFYNSANTSFTFYYANPRVSPFAYLTGHSGPTTTRGFHVFFLTPQGCFDQRQYLAAQNIILPVSFKSFTAKRNKQNVVLSWQTATEQNNAGFAIERNINGNWTEIAFVPSQANGGNSSSELSYTYNDLNNHKGISQYRIRQNDLDAKTSYSVIRSVQGEGAGPKLVIYPNPSVDGRVQLVFEDANNSRHIVISDLSGRIVRQINNVLNSSLSIDGLNAGVYTARVINQATGESVLQKFVIQQKLKGTD